MVVHRPVARQPAEQGVGVHADDLMPVYRDVAREFVSEAERLGKETHNGVWISTALLTSWHQGGARRSPCGTRGRGVFFGLRRQRPGITGTAEMLVTLQPHYRLAVVSNLTHGPAARQILDHLDLTPFFRGHIGIRRSGVTANRTRGCFKAWWRRWTLPPSSIAFVG